MPRPNIRVMEHVKDNDSGYKSLAAAILGQAIQDYAFPQSFSVNGDNGKVSVEMANRNRQDLDKFFLSEWCEELCEAIDFPQKVLMNKDLIVRAGRRIRGRRQGPKLRTGGV